MRLGFVIVAASLVIACGLTPPAPDKILTDIADALGGRQRILAVKTMLIEGRGQGNLLLEGMPQAASEPFLLSDYRLAVDLVGGRWRIEETRRIGSGEPQHLTFGIDGTTVYDRIDDGSYSQASKEVADYRRTAYYQHPLTLVRGALNRAQLCCPLYIGDSGNTLAVAVTTDDQSTYRMLVGRSSNLPEELMESGRYFSTDFSNYREVNGLRLPFGIHTEMDWDKGSTKLDIVIDKLTLDAELGDLSAPR